MSELFEGFLRRRHSSHYPSSNRSSQVNGKNDTGMDSGPFPLEYQMMDAMTRKELDKHQDNGHHNKKLSGNERAIKSRKNEKQSSVGKALDEAKLSSDENLGIGGGKCKSCSNCDCGFAMLNYTEVQGPRDLSQDQALNFVDQFLAINIIDSPKPVGSRKADRIASPPCCVVKGIQSLARRENTGNAFLESFAFKWTESQDKNEKTGFFSDINQSTRRGECHEGRGNEMQQGSQNVSFHEQKIQVNLSKEKLPDTIMTSDLLDSKLQDYNEIQKAHINEQFNCEPLGQSEDYGRVVGDMFDVGLDTQIAAEAMEALNYAPPPNTDACCSHQDPENDLRGTFSNENANSSVLEQWGSHKSVHFKAGDDPKQRKQARKPDNKLSGHQSCSVNHSKRPRVSYSDVHTTGLVNKDALREKILNCKDLPVRKKRSCRRSFEVCSQQPKEGYSGMDSSKEFHFDSKSKLVGAPCRRELTNWKLEKFSALAERTRRLSSVSLSKTSVAQIISSKERTNKKIAVDFSKRRRKANRSDDALMTIEDNEKSSKICLDLSAKVSDGTINQRGQVTKDGESMPCLLTLNPWTYTKGKRTRQQVARHSNGQEDGHSTFTVYEMDNGKYCPIGDHKEERKSGMLVYPHSNESLLKKGCTGNLSGQKSVANLAGVVNSKCIVMTRTLSATCVPESEIVQARQLDNPCSIPSSDNSVKTRSDEIKQRNSAISCIKGAGEECRLNCKRNLSGQPLLRELIRLGYAEALPDFIPKCSRRRKGSTSIHVLFSQNLDSNIIKQQKKILERLGFSIASCCSDATHFVTDRFARTRNMLEAIARGKPVVTHLWLENCGQASGYVDEKKYILRDVKKEKEIGFSMPVSLARARQCPLLKGMKVFITPNVKPGRDLIQSLVTEVSGKAVKKPCGTERNDKIIPDDLLILSCEEDHAMCIPFLEKGAAVYSSELLLNGIVIQKLEFERHQLFTNYVSRECADVY